MSMQDLVYKVATRKVLRGRIRYYTVYTKNLPTSDVFIIQILDVM